MNDGNIEKLNDEMYSISCFLCGTTANLQILPHRNHAHAMVGLVYFCSKCAQQAPGARVTVDLGDTGKAKETK